MEQPWCQSGLGPDLLGKGLSSIIIFRACKGNISISLIQAGLFYVTSMTSTSLVSGLAYTLLRFETN